LNSCFFLGTRFLLRSPLNRHNNDSHIETAGRMITLRVPKYWGEAQRYIDGGFITRITCGQLVRLSSRTDGEHEFNVRVPHTLLVKLEGLRAIVPARDGSLVHKWPPDSNPSSYCSSPDRLRRQRQLFTRGPSAERIRYATISPEHRPN
jgi:hypothetical protein